MLSLKDLMLTGEAKEKADQRHKENCLKWAKEDEEKRKKELERISHEFAQNNLRFYNQQQAHKEMLIDVQVEAVRRIEVEKRAATQPQVNDDNTSNITKTRKKMPEKRLDALKEWLVSLEYTLDDELIILPAHYTLIYVYTELGRLYPRLFQHITPESFDSHFWGKQKIVELMRGNKSGIL